MPNVYKCSCKWNEECLKLRESFALASKDDPRGKPCYRIDLSGNSETKRIWRKSILRNLNIVEDNVNIKFVS